MIIGTLNQVVTKTRAKVIWQMAITLDVAVVC